MPDDVARHPSSSHRVVLGTARDDETGAVVALWRECGLTRPWNDPVADLAAARQTPTSTVLVARVETGGPGAGPGAATSDGASEQVVGTVMTGFDGHRGWLYYLAVAPSAQRRGVGRSLVVAAEAWLAAQGAPAVRLMVRSENAAVVAFYAALGYVDQDCVVLGRSLGQP